MKKQIVILLLFASLTSAFADTSFQYKFKAPQDIWLVGGGLLLTGIGELFSHRIFPPNPESLDRSKIFLPDQFALRFESSTAAQLSDITLGILALSPLVIIVSENSHSKDWTETALYFESQIWTIGFTELCKGIVHRPRPYAYHAETESMDKEAARSFLSGHTSIAFAGAVSTAIYWEHFHPDSKWNNAVWISSLSLATTTGVLRILAGKHFPTDVLASAIVGSLIGWAIPQMHREDVVPEINTLPQPMMLDIQFAL
ncbi:phosphatase PAP2 family protein [candidate division KSB1 bacterium]|nr:phosphatase PAP2 family protein [candidate division KSB1 bacterium]